MHIIHYNLTTTSKVGGVESFVWELAQQQVRLGHRVTIVGGNGSIKRPMHGLRVMTFPFIARERLAWGPLRRAYAWRKLAERLSLLPRAWPILKTADLVHIHKPYDLVVAPLLKRHGIPTVYHGHGEDFFRGDVQLMNSAAALLSCSSYNAQTLQQHYGRTATVVYNGVDLEHFRPLEPELRLRHAIAGDAKWLLVQPGRMMPWKGQRDAITALSLLDEQYHLAFLGDGETRQELADYAQSLGIADRIHLLGTIAHSELPRYLACADLVLGTSYTSETFGMALAEAQACGKAVVASSWRGYDDVVQAGSTGERFKAQDPADLARVIAQLCADDGYREQLAQAGRQRVQQLFPWSAIAERVEAVYQNIEHRT
ncbi:glycosyltransferase family 4 protein [Herpetosiphon geysericola]|uniref:Glycosyl transferase family 1 n=1 Tax=Herpetosiphon geysericola TaxID=70996 RepID=A0A0P6Z159_9CHLR|nr:glycosyltransferase family 4 protein [Herpetosiphon geysericola]KPL90709.1 hypothetical protein SE18_04850 [Herpetosiphon geysericola]